MSTFNGKLLLDELKKKQNLLESDLKLINKVQDFISKYLNHYLQDGKVLFVDFKYLSRVMELVEMDGKSQLETYLAFVTANIKTGLLEYDKNLHLDEADYLKIIKTAKNMNIVLTPIKMFEIYEKYKNAEPLCIWEEKILDLILKSTSKVEKLISPTKIIYNNYLQKRDSYTIEDLESIIKAFKDLGIENESCRKIKKGFIKDLKERGEIATTKKEVFVPVEDKKDFKSLSDEEKEKLVREVKKYKKIDEELSLSTRIEITKKMLLIHCDKKEINNFLSMSDVMYNFLSNSKNNEVVRDNISLDKLISMYQDNYEKYSYYSEEYGLKEILENIDTYIELAKEKGSKEELEYIRIEMYKELLLLYEALPKIYDYELAEGKRRIKK